MMSWSVRPLQAVWSSEYVSVSFPLVRGCFRRSSNYFLSHFAVRKLFVEQELFDDCEWEFSCSEGVLAIVFFATIKPSNVCFDYTGCHNLHLDDVFQQPTTYAVCEVMPSEPGSAGSNWSKHCQTEIVEVSLDVCQMN